MEFCTSSPQQDVKCQLRLGRGGGLYNISYQIPIGKVLAHLEFKWKVLPGSWKYISAWVGFCTSNPHQGVKFQLRFCGVGSMNISCKIPNGKILSSAAKHIYHATTFTHMKWLPFEYKVVLLAMFSMVNFVRFIIKNKKNMKTIAILNSTMRSPHSTSEWNDRFKIENFNTFFQLVITNNS